MKKTYIIGDIHGEFDTLLALVDKLPQNAEMMKQFKNDNELSAFCVQTQEVVSMSRV